MTVKLTRYMQEPDSSTVLFFLRNKKVFAIIVPESLPLIIACEANRFATATNARYTGYSMKPSQWNEYIEKDINPVNVIHALLYENGLETKNIPIKKPTA